MTAPIVDIAPETAAGLTTQQARAELARVGPNVLAEAEPPHWLVCSRSAPSARSPA